MTKYQIKIKLKEGIKDIEAETLMTFVDASDGIRSIKTGSIYYCLLYTSPSPRDRTRSRMPSSA